MQIEDDSTDELIAEWDRGSLTYPSEFLIQIVAFSLIIFDMLTSRTHEENFLKSEIRHKLLRSKLTELKLIKNDICKQNDICLWGKHIINLVKDALSRSANILISNYLKIKNQSVKKKCKRKIKKLKNYIQK